MAKRRRNKLISKIIFIFVLVMVTFTFEFIRNMDNSYSISNEVTSTSKKTKEFVEAEKVETIESVSSLDSIPAYDGNDYITINNNKPSFTEDSYKEESFELYSKLDSLGRCGVAYANIGKDLMPTEERTSIGNVKPTGWHTVKYDIVSGKYLYNRCHLIGYQLTGENANDENLITCTRSMNAETMLYFEDMVANYIKETGNHVLYRVTPVFEGDNLLATGVQMEAASVEDKCGKICFNVFVYNVQEGIEIDYSNGDSKLIE